MTISALLFLDSPQAWVLAIGFLLVVLTTAFVAFSYIAYWWTTQRPGRGHPTYTPPRERHEVIGGGNARVSAEDRWAA